MEQSQIDGDHLTLEDVSRVAGAEPGAVEITMGDDAAAKIGRARRQRYCIMSS